LPDPLHDPAGKPAGHRPNRDSEARQGPELRRLAAKNSVVDSSQIPCIW
jgi:hypothetical protein